MLDKANNNNTKQNKTKNKQQCSIMHSHIHQGHIKALSIKLNFC